MQKIFVCLANSKKYGGRCLAGIELTLDAAGKPHLALDATGNPHWIRPVAHTEHGEVPQAAVQHIHLLDIVVFEYEAACPQGYQTENVYYQGNTFESCGKLNAKPENLNQLVDNQTDTLLGNRQKFLTVEEAAALEKSIVLVKATEGSLKLYEMGAQLRTGFRWQHTYYDLPVTDLDFHLRWIDDPKLLEGKTNIYLCVSLAINFEGRHHKLVAGILGC